MKIYKDKQFLIFDYEDGRTVKYDFATKTAIGFKNKKVKNLQGQLTGFTIDNLLESFEDKNYAKFLMFIADTSMFKLYNIGTILNRVPEYSKFEQLFSAELDISKHDGIKFRYSINEIPKSLQKLSRLHNITLSNRVVDNYKKTPEAINIAYQLDFTSLSATDIFEVWNGSRYLWDCNEVRTHFCKLVNDFGYQPKELWLYLDKLKTFEAIENVENIVREIYDYAKMMSVISLKYDKYPRNFLTTHAIASRNYTRMRKQFPEDLFKRRITKKYECSFGNYSFIYPKSTQDIKDEAASQNNCVASYIDDVIEGKCHILFLRKNDKLNESLVTIEVVNNKIVQAKRRFNEPVTEEEQNVIDLFNEKFINERNLAI